jgi:hypothetical protein
MIRVRVSLQVSVALYLALIGIKLLFPDYERNLPGDSKSETLMMQCQIPSTEAIVRLYEGKGGDWYTITFSEGKSNLLEGKIFREKEIFYAYSSPRLESIKCNKKGLEIFPLSGQNLILTLEQIKNKLIYKPMYLYRGQQEELSVPTLDIPRLILGMFLELISIWILVRSVKQVRASKNPELDLPMDT